MTLRRVTSERKQVEKKKKNHERLMQAFWKVAMAKKVREARHLKNAEADLAANNADIAYQEARIKILKEDEDVTPPQWDSPAGWVKVKTKSLTAFTLDMKDPHDYVAATLVEDPKKSKGAMTLLRRQLRWELGSFRIVYLAMLEKRKRIAKYLISPRGYEEDLKAVKATVVQYVVGQHVVKRFVAAVKEKGKAVNMKYIDTDMLTLDSNELVMCEECAGEDFRQGDGKFIKWNNNGTMVNDEEPKYPGGIDPYPQALSHFSYIDSNFTHLLTDVQGWRNSSGHYIFTDPAFHTDHRKTDGGYSGGADRGTKGFKDFFDNHKCNEICKLLELHKKHKFKG